MRKVFICSPYRGDIRENTRKAEIYCHRAIKAGMLPIAPHLYFPRFLDEDKPEDRTLGIEMGIELMKHCDEMWVYGEPTEGMRFEIAAWKDWINQGYAGPIRYAEEAV